VPARPAAAFAGRGPIGSEGALRRADREKPPRDRPADRGAFRPRRQSRLARSRNISSHHRKAVRGFHRRLQPRVEEQGGGDPGNLPQCAGRLRTAPSGFLPTSPMCQRGRVRNRHGPGSQVLSAARSLSWRQQSPQARSRQIPGLRSGRPDGRSPRAPAHRSTLGQFGVTLYAVASAGCTGRRPIISDSTAARMACYTCDHEGLADNHPALERMKPAKKAAQAAPN